MVLPLAGLTERRLSDQAAVVSRPTGAQRSLAFDGFAMGQGSTVPST